MGALTRGTKGRTPRKDTTPPPDLTGSDLLGFHGRSSDHCFTTTTTNEPLVLGSRLCSVLRQVDTSTFQIDEHVSNFTGGVTFKVKVDGKEIMGYQGNYNKASFEYGIQASKGKQVKLDKFQLPPELRYKGYGPRILSALLQLYREAGCHSIVVPAPTDQGRKLYRKLGFTKNAVQTLELKLQVEESGGRSQIRRSTRSSAHCDTSFVLEETSSMSLPECCVSEDSDDESHLQDPSFPPQVAAYFDWSLWKTVAVSLVVLLMSLLMPMESWKYYDCSF